MEFLSLFIKFTPCQDVSDARTVLRVSVHIIPGVPHTQRLPTYFLCLVGMPISFRIVRLSVVNRLSHVCDRLASQGEL